MHVPGLRRLVASLLLAASLAAFVRAESAPAPVLLISMDGFRWDYLDLHPAESPRLHQIRAEGISAASLIPVYPSNTFPNHYALATGLYPAHHGIINNQFFDPTLGEYYYSGRSKWNSESKWWGGEPIWITAVLQGQPSACSFWVGSEAPIKGVRPTYWKRYDYSIPFAKRLEELVGWLKLPPGKRPTELSFYLEETNTAGHKYGPDTPELIDAIKLQDGRIGMIQDRLKAEHIPINLVLVSDHGMTSLKPDSPIFVDDYINLKEAQIDFDGPEMGLRPLKGTAAQLVQALAHLPHAKAYLSENLPARLHLTGNPRIPPVWIMMDEGYEIHPRGWINQPKEYVLKAQHGYDNALQTMHGILLAHGPAFKTGGLVVPDVPNVDVYNLLCAIEHLKPAANDGDDTLIREFLR